MLSYDYEDLLQIQHAFTHLSVDIVLFALNVLNSFE